MGKFNLFLLNGKERCLQMLIKIKTATIVAVFSIKIECFYLKSASVALFISYDFTFIVMSIPIWFTEIV